MLTVKGRINERGELETELPDGVEPGDVTVTIAYETAAHTPDADDTWTDEELAELIKPRDPSQSPLTSAEIVEHLNKMRPTGWEGMPDGATWVEQQREERRRRLQW